MFKNLIPWKHSEEGGLSQRSQADAMTQLRSDVDRMLQQFFNDDETQQWNSSLGCEVEDGEEAVLVRAEAPGFEPDEFDVQLSGNRLIVKAEHKQDEKEGNGHVTRQRRVYRSMTIPAGVEPDKIEAKYKNGILEMRLPKGESTKTRRINVSAK